MIQLPPQPSTPQDLTHASGSILFQLTGLCGPPEISPGHTLQVLGMLFHDLCSFWKLLQSTLHSQTISRGSRDHTRAYSFLTQSLESLRIAQEWSKLSRLAISGCWWMMVCHPKCYGMLPLTHVSLVCHHCFNLCCCTMEESIPEVFLQYFAYQSLSQHFTSKHLCSLFFWH